MNSFFILGHGLEETIGFEERRTIPEGITLVTFAECGIVTTTKEVCPMTEAFTDPANRDIFANPRQNKGAIRMFLNGKDIHVYTQGNKYPNLSLQLYLDWKNEDFVKITKSGLYSFPLDREQFQIGPSSDFCESIFKRFGPYHGFPEKLPTDFDTNVMYGGSLYPTVAEVEAMRLAVKNNVGKLKNRLTVNLETIFERGGPGVYYYVVCRHPTNTVAPEEIKERVQLINNNSIRPYFAHNWMTPERLEPIMMALDETSSSIGPGWQRNELSNILRSYRRLHNVPRIRRRSIEQQEAANAAAAATSQQGRGRIQRKKSRKHKRALRKTRKHRSV